MILASLTLIQIAKSSFWAAADHCLSDGAPGHHVFRVNDGSGVLVELDPESLQSLNFPVLVLLHHVDRARDSSNISRDVVVLVLADLYFAVGNFIRSEYPHCSLCVGYLQEPSFRLDSHCENNKTRYRSYIVHAQPF
jgi:hypothetical protein